MMKCAVGRPPLALPCFWLYLTEGCFFAQFCSLSDHFLLTFARILLTFCKCSTGNYIQLTEERVSLYRTYSVSYKSCNSFSL
jgi:hypothetical protein